MNSKHPVVLIIRDGWGYNASDEGNYIRQAETPNEDSYLAQYPHSLLRASGTAVGLDDGFQGNSEVGHMTIGSGRVIFQSMARINKAISDGDFYSNPALVAAVDSCRDKGGNLHLIGLLQTQGVHAHINHLLALLELCRRQNCRQVYVHVITDGRDAPVTESLQHLQTLQAKLDELGFGRIATVSGRYYAMDRDKRWDRTEQAYRTIVDGQGEEFSEAAAVVAERHQAGETDEFIRPCRLAGYAGFAANDSVVFFNFRTDRTRQLTQAIIEPDFIGFSRSYLPVQFVAMTQYYEPMPAPVAFGNISLNNLLGEIVSRAGCKQLRISETEKYAHVTFFFNGQQETPSVGEDRVLIPSPKVATYDLQPEMSAPLIAERLVAEINKQEYDLVVTNLVNGDMVGHTGDRQAILQAIEAVDAAQGKIVAAALANGYSCLLLADHGNAEDKTAATATSHTTNPVPLILVSQEPALINVKLADGGLSDIAPTVLALLGIDQPGEMSGHSLLAA